MSVQMPGATSMTGTSLHNALLADSETHQLLSGFQFFLLLVVTAIAYYAALFISANAVGESTASLSAPFAAASNIVADVGNTIVRGINRRRNNTQPGAVSYEEVNDDDNDLFLGVNQPAAGARS